MSANWVFGGLFVLSTCTNRLLQRARSKSLDLELLTLDNTFLDYAELLPGIKTFKDYDDKETCLSVFKCGHFGISETVKIYWWGYRAISTTDPAKSHTVERDDLCFDLHHLYALEINPKLIQNTGGARIRPRQLVFPVTRKECSTAAESTYWAFVNLSVSRMLLRANAVLLMASWLFYKEADPSIRCSLLISALLLSLLGFLLTSVALINLSECCGNGIASRFTLRGSKIGIKASPGANIVDRVGSATCCTLVLFVCSVVGICILED